MLLFRLRLCYCLRATYYYYYNVYEGKKASVVPNNVSNVSFLYIVSINLITEVRLEHVIIRTHVSNANNFFLMQNVFRKWFSFNMLSNL